MEIEEVEHIGEGGFGVVHKVRDAEGHLWARKTFDPSNFATEDPAILRKRFEREVKYQGAIDHPNVARIVAHRLDVTPPYFLMDLAETTLQKELSADRMLGGKMGQALFDILAGLETIHSIGINHRDLKPGNVLKLRNADGSSRYAISDFGLMSVNKSDITQITASNYQGGSLWYAAPELAADLKRSTYLSDIYSFGAILHDIFDGNPRVPFSELLAPGPIGQIIAKCTKKLPARRYASVAQLRNELYPVLAQIEHTGIVGTPEDDEAVALLKEGRPLANDEWDTVILRVDRNVNGGFSCMAIFEALQILHIEQLAKESPELLVVLGEPFASHMDLGSFSFTYCDVLATKAETFFKHAAVGLQAEIVLALLSMGVGHNRFMVMHMFTRLAGKDASAVLATRMRIEIEMREIDFLAKIVRLEWAISFNRDNLHPILRTLLPPKG